MKTNYQKTLRKIKRLNKVIYGILHFKTLGSSTSKRARRSVERLSNDVEDLKYRLYA